MAKPLVVNNVTYNYPEPGEDPSWAEDSTAWAEAVTNVLNTLLAPGDILQTTATISDNISSATDINGLAFDPTIVRAANVTYSIYRTCNDSPSGNAETGTIYLVYDNSASAGNKWKFAQKTDGSAGVTFSITDTGQIQYTSNQLNVGAGGYSGTMKFLARTLST